jgi:predicted nucleic acid-binding protein
LAGVIEVVRCLDSSVWLKALTNEEPLTLSDIANDLVLDTAHRGELVAPAFAWAEVGSVLRKKLRQGIIAEDQAAMLWERFIRLPIRFFDSTALRRRTWEIADTYGLATIYDASYLACTEVSFESIRVEREFWTSDLSLVRTLTPLPPPYLRILSERTDADA